jgi:hypothetical protein
MATAVVAKEKSGAADPHHDVDFCGQKWTVFPVPGGQNGWPFRDELAFGLLNHG